MLKELRLQYHWFMAAYHVARHTRIYNSCQTPNELRQNDGVLGRGIESIINHMRVVANLTDSNDERHIKATKMVADLEKSQETYVLQKRMAQHVIDGVMADLEQRSK